MTNPESNKKALVQYSFLAWLSPTREIPSKREKNEEKKKGKQCAKLYLYILPSSPQDRMNLSDLVSFLRSTKMFIFYLRDLLSPFAPLLVIFMAALLLFATSQFNHHEFEVGINEQVRELAQFVFGPDAELVHQPKQYVVQKIDYG